MEINNGAIWLIESLELTCGWALAASCDIKYHEEDGTLFVIEGLPELGDVYNPCVSTLKDKLENELDTLRSLQYDTLDGWSEEDYEAAWESAVSIYNYILYTERKGGVRGSHLGSSNDYSRD